MIKYIRSHLSVKILCISLIFLLGISAMVYGLVVISMPKSYLMEFEKSLDANVRELIPQLKNLTFEEGDVLLEKFAEKYGLSINLINEKGENVHEFGNTVSSLASDATPDEAMEVNNEMKASSKLYALTFKDGRHYSIEVMNNNGLQSLHLPLKSIQHLFPVVFVLSLLVSVAASLLMVRYVAKPIVKVSRVSKEMSKLKFDIKVGDARSDEIGTLGENLNELSDRLDQALTGLRDSNEKLKKEVKERRELEQQQLTFFTSVSHELKTPVTVLKGQLEGMIYKVGGYSDREKYLRRSYQVTCSMEDLVKEILSVSKLKSTEFEVRQEEIGIEDIINEVLIEQEDMAVDRGIHIVRQFGGNLRTVTDPVLIKKVISNLLGNAIKYTLEGGSIWISGVHTDGGIAISLENTCSPIPEEEREKLFHAFYRMEQSRNRSTGGSGLGLYIVKTIMELLHDPLELENTPRGVKVSFLLK